jgi:cysteine desulfurase
MSKNFKKKNIYLDYASATPVSREVEKVMQGFCRVNFGNPSSVHSLGVKAKQALSSARQTCAQILNSRIEEIFFTAGGTESINLAILGAVRNFKKGSHIITTQIEHRSVLESFRQLEIEGYKTTYLPVNREGFISLKNLESKILPETIFLSVIYANNEIGTIQQIGEIGKLLRVVNQQRRIQKLPEIVFHTDACQAVGFCDLNVQSLGVDLLSLNASKIYGPKQVGILYKRAGINLKPIFFGGGQEKNVRSGTENMAGVVGLAKALELSVKNRKKEIHRLLILRDYFIKKVLTNIPKSFLNGPNRVNKNFNRLPNNINICFEGVEGEALAIYLDAQGIQVSTGSACATQEPEASHVLLALGLSEIDAKSCVRITLGNETTKKDLDFVLKILPDLIKSLRKLNKLLKAL